MPGTCNFHARSTCNACQEHALLHASNVCKSSPGATAVIYCSSTVNPMQVELAISSQYHVLFLAMNMEISMPVARGISQQKNCTSTPKAHATLRRYRAQLNADTARNSTPILRATRRRYRAQLHADTARNSTPILRATWRPEPQHYWHRYRYLCKSYR